MSKRVEGRRYGYLHEGNNDVFVRALKGQQVAGYSVGILYIENVHYPMMPGNVVNAYTYDFPVRMMAVPNLTNHRLFAADQSVADDIIAAAKHLVEKEGVRAISSACGFFGNFHQQVAANLDVPVAMSSLVQVPWIRQVIKPGKKIGILTANGEAMNADLFNACGIEKHDNLLVGDMLQSKEFAAVVDMRGHFDNGIVKQEIAAAALKLVENHPDLGAILLECSDMPPYAALVQEVTQLPVFDFITLIKWLHNCTTQRPYAGWV